VALMRVYCGLAATDPTNADGSANWLTVAVVDDAGRLLDICDIADEPTGFAQLGALLAERSGGANSVAIAADSEDHQVVLLISAAGGPLAIVDDETVSDYADRFADDESPEEMSAGPAERHAVGLARALQAGALAAEGQAAPRELVGLKPVLAAHASVAAGRHGTAVALREVLRELYPAALRAYPDPAEPIPLAILDALPEPGLLGAAAANRGRDANVAMELAESGIADATTISEAITALRVAIAETPRRTGIGKGTTAAVAETIRQAVAAVRACDAATTALIGLLAEKMPSRPAAPPQVVARPRAVPVTPAPQTPAPAEPVRTGGRRRAAAVAPVSPAAQPVSPAPNRTSLPRTSRSVARSAAVTSAPPAAASAPPAMAAPPTMTPPPAMMPPAAMTPPPAMAPPRGHQSAPPAPPQQSPITPVYTEPSYPSPSYANGSSYEPGPAYRDEPSFDSGYDPYRQIPAAPPFQPSEPPAPPTQPSWNTPSTYAPNGYGMDQPRPASDPYAATNGYAYAANNEGYPLSPEVAPLGRDGWPTNGHELDDALAAAPIPHQRDGRVAPPWQSDMPAEPPALRLVEPEPEPVSQGAAHLRLITNTDMPTNGAQRGSGGSRHASTNGGSGSPEDGDLLIFAQMRSAWWSGPTEADEPQWSDADADAGWSAALRAAEPQFAEETSVGLPRRVPQANLVPGSPLPPAPERALRIVRDPELIAAHTSGYFRGSRRGEEVRGYAVGGRPGREAAGSWDFSRDHWESDRDSAYRSAAHR